MFGYWFSYLLVALIALLPKQMHVRHATMLWFLLGLYFILFVGLRHEVGGDWEPYLYHYEFAANHTFFSVLASGDVAYAMLNWIAVNLDISIYSVNLVCATIFVTGLISFCKKQPEPILSFIVAIPYLIVVLAMGYTRQAAAIGLVFFALNQLAEHRLFKFIIFVVIGALFHKSAIIMLPLAAFVFGRERLVHFTGVASFTIIFSYLFLEDYYDALWQNYVLSNMKSDGGLVRVLMNSVPSALLFILWKHYKARWDDVFLWRWLAIASILCIPLVGLASTAVDRVALYFTPIQLVVLSRLPGLFLLKKQRDLIVLVTMLVYGLVLYVWLNFATHAVYWLPYKNLLFSDL